MQKQLTADVCSDISLTVLALEDKYNQCKLFSERNLTLQNHVILLANRGLISDCERFCCSYSILLAYISSIIP